MACDLYQDRILEYDQLTASEQQSVDAHLRACPACREFAQRWQALDGALARQLRAPALSPDFDAQLRQRIAREAPSTAQANLAERRRALEAEYAAARQRQTLRRWIPRLLDVLGCGVAGGIGGWLLVTLLTQAGAASTAFPALTGPQMLVASSVAGIIIAFGTVALAFNRPLRQSLVR